MKGKKTKFWFKIGIAIFIVIVLAITFSGGTSNNNAERLNSISTKFNPLDSHSIETMRFTDPQIKNLNCYVSSAKTGGFFGAIGVAEDASDMSISCVLSGDKANYNGNLNGNEVVYKESRSVTFKTLKVVRNYDEETNTVYYVAYSDKILDGDNNNATSAVWLGNK